MLRRLRHWSRLNYGHKAKNITSSIAYVRDGEAVVNVLLPKDTTRLGRNSLGLVVMLELF